MVQIGFHGYNTIPAHIVIAIAAVLFYLYIYLRIATGSPLKGTAPTLSLHRSALTFDALGLLLFCGISGL